MIKNKKAVLPLLALFFSPIGVVILAILALVLFGFLSFGVFLTLNLLTIGGIILVIAGLIAIINGNVNPVILTIVILGVIMLMLPLLIDGLSRFTLAAVLE